MLAATLLPEDHGTDLTEGAGLPPLWHWCAFPPTHPMAETGPDGHARLGGFLPDLGLSRRMWAGGSLEFLRPLTIGAPLTRRSEILSVEHKTTSGGPMAVVRVHHSIEDGDGPAILEDQNIVYLDIPDRYTPPKPRPVPEGPFLLDEVEAMDPVRLFRYSAVTFNGHRIHYDRTYATEVEHYPGLVVHGPLQATFLIAAATRLRGRPPGRFAYRGLHPMFDTHDLRVIAREDGPEALSLCTAAAIPDGPQGTTATAEWTT
jgi:3-methylfumaryl-CoA hydratase